MRERARGVAGWIVMGAIILVLSVFGFTSFSFFNVGDTTVAEVGDVDIGLNQLAVAVERQRRQILQNLGPGVDPSLIDEALLRDSVLRSLVERALMIQGAEDAGVHVTDAEIDEIITQIPGFLTDGQFDPDRFRFSLAQSGMTPATFREGLTEDLMVGQLSSAVGDSTLLTRSDLQRLAGLSLQERDIAWLLFNPDAYLEEAQPEQSEVEAFYAEHAEDYRAPEQLSIRYLQLDLNALAAEQEIDDEAVRQAYEEEVARFEGQEEREAAHIQLLVDEDRSREEALALARELVERLRSGEAFAALATEYSDDIGSRSNGGQLGYLSRGVFDPAFETALFALQEGEISDPVETADAVHVIRLGEIRRSDPPPFFAREMELRDSLQLERARELFEEQRLRLEDLAYESDDLVAPAEALGLTVREAGPFTREGAPDGIASSALVVDAAFDEEVRLQGYNSRPLEIADGIVVVLRVSEREPSRLRELAEVEAEVRSNLAEDRAREIALQRGSEALARLEAGTAVSGVAAEAGMDWQRVDGLRRNDTRAPAPLRDGAFLLPRPGEAARSVDSVVFGDGRYAVVMVTAVRDGDLATLTAAEREQFEAVVTNRTSGMEFAAYQELLEQQLGVEVSDVDG